MNSADERAAIVAWLRKEANFQRKTAASLDGVLAQCVNSFAIGLENSINAIERGEHLNQGKQEADDPEQKPGATNNE